VAGRKGVSQSASIEVTRLKGAPASGSMEKFAETVEEERGDTFTEPAIFGMENHCRACPTIRRKGKARVQEGPHH